MPVFVEDPSRFTKEKLRDHLIAHHVPLPEGDPKKEVYLQMYRKHVASEQKTTDFSSDEDDDSLTETCVPAKRVTETISHKMDVNQLSDRELKEQLIKHGTVPGPILPTTRTVYEKKLKQLLDQGPPVSQARLNGTGDMEQYSDSDEEGPRDNSVQLRRENTITNVSNSSIFNNSKQKRPMLTVVVPIPRRSSLTSIPNRSDYTNSTRTLHQEVNKAPSEANQPNREFESSFSVTKMVEQMEQRPEISQMAAHQKMLASRSPNNYNVKDSLMVDKNTMTFRMPSNTPKGCVFVKQNGYQADDFLQQGELADRFGSSTPSPLGMSATRRKPIKGAAGRPIQFKYDDIATQAKLVEHAKQTVAKGLSRKMVPVYVKVAVFLIVAFLALVFLTMENNPENPFHPYIEQVEIQHPQ